MDGIDSRKSEKDAIEFFEDYGAYVEYGTYIFGATYTMLNKLKWEKEQSLSDRSEIASFDTKLAISGAGICQYGIGGAKGSFNTSDSSAKQSGESSSK